VYECQQGNKFLTKRVKDKFWFYASIFMACVCDAQDGMVILFFGKKKKFLNNFESIDK